MSFREHIQTLISYLLMIILLLNFPKPCGSMLFPAVIQLQKDRRNFFLAWIANSITPGAFYGNANFRLDSLSSTFTLKTWLKEVDIKEKEMLNIGVDVRLIQGVFYIQPLCVYIYVCVCDLCLFIVWDF